MVLLPMGAALPTDWTTLAGWEGVIDNADESNQYAKYFEGIGEIPVPQKVFIENAKGYKRVANKQYDFNMEVISMSDQMLKFLKHLQCGAVDYTFWVLVSSGHILGGKNGLSPSFQEVDFPFLRGVDSIQKALLNIEWHSLCDVDRAYIEDFETVVMSNIAPDVLGSADRITWGSSDKIVWSA